MKKKQICITKQPSLAKVKTAKQSLSMCILRSLWHKHRERERDDEFRKDLFRERKLTEKQIKKTIKKATKAPD